MEGLRDRINEVRDHYRLTNRGFADAIGAKPAATNNYLNGTKEPSMEFYRQNTDYIRRHISRLATLWQRQYVLRCRQADGRKTAERTSRNKSKVASTGRSG